MMRLRKTILHNIIFPESILLLAHKLSKKYGDVLNFSHLNQLRLIFHFNNLVTYIPKIPSSKIIKNTVYLKQLRFLVISRNYFRRVYEY